MFEDLAIGAGGPLIDVLIMFVHVVRNRLVLILLKSVPPLISYDIICVETLHLINVVMC